MRKQTHLAVGTAMTALLLAPAVCLAQDGVRYSSDISVDLSGTTVDDEDAVLDDQLGVVTQEPLGALPENAGLTGYDVLGNGDRLFTLDTTVELGGTTFTPADVVRFDGITYTAEFDGSAEGIPDGVRVDALSVESSGDLLLSFDTTVDLGGGVVAADEDLAQFDGATFTLLFDGSAEGISEALDLDGASADISGLLSLSFDGSGSVGGVDFDDEDILAFDSSGSVWTMAFEGEVAHPSLAAADIDAVPEPGQSLLLAAGSLGLWALSAYRRRRNRPSRQLSRRNHAERIESF